MRTGRARQSGIVLFAVLATLAALGLLAGTLAIVTLTDLRVAAHFHRAMGALYAADAGVNHVRSRIQAGLVAGTLSLTGATVTVNSTAPSGYTFDPVRSLTRTDDEDCYLFAVTGRAGTSRDTIEAVVRRESVFDIGVFGDQSVDGKNSAGIYTYDSDRVHAPQPADSTGDAVVGCNGDGDSRSADVRTFQDTYVDGTFLLGTSSGGTGATWGETPSGGSEVTGGDPVPADRVDPDPLGAVGGQLAADFVHYASPANNDNSTVSPAIRAPNYDLSINNRETVVLAAGDYYIRNLTINQGGTLRIDASAGPVNIYLTGQLEAKNGSTINNAGDPPDLTIYCNSDRTIALKNSGTFRGVIYAPLADVQVYNNGDYCGVVWAQTVDIKNSGEVYIDEAAIRKHLSNRILLVSWRELRE